MSSEEIKITFNKENLDSYLNDLSKKYKKLGGRNMPAEIILVGGAAVIEKYGFRDMTTDIDAVINAASMMKDAINQTGDEAGLPNGWLNTDFTKTASYSKNLLKHSVYYKTFNQTLSVRIVTSEYLIAMKLCSGREYKNDLSDIAGILMEHEKAGNPISYEQIDKAVKDLYGDWDSIPKESVEFLHDTMEHGDYEATYRDICSFEKRAKRFLMKFERDYPDVLNQENLTDILHRSIKKNGTHEEQGSGEEQEGGEEKE